MPRTSSARRTRQPKSQPILTTYEFCVSCHKRLPAKRGDNTMVAVGTTCPVCDKAMCLKCAKKKRTFDEESPVAKHIREDEQVARNRAFDHLLFNVDERDATFDTIDRLVDERVAVMCRANDPVASMKRMIALSRMGRDISPVAYGTDQMVMARILVLYLRGEFDAPVVTMAIAPIDPYRIQIPNPPPASSFAMLRAGEHPIGPVLMQPSSAHSLPDATEEVAQAATLDRPIKLYVGTAVPGDGIKG
jgi:hypothetical protein